MAICHRDLELDNALLDPAFLHIPLHNPLYGPLHNPLQGVCHRDLKLENALLDHPVSPAAAQELGVLLAEAPLVKLCDFGYSKVS